MANNLYWPLLVSVLALLICAPSRQEEARPARVGKDPGFFNLRSWLARIHFLLNGRKLIEQAYLKSKDAVYVVQTLLGDQIVLGPRFLPELRMLPESSLNATAALVDSVLGSYSGVDILLNGHLTSDICRGPLTRNLHNVLPQMIDELQLAKADLLGEQCVQDPVQLVAYDLIYSLISRVSSRAFVGAPICHNKTWIRAVNAFPMDVEKVKFALLIFPEFVRPWLAPWLPQRRRLARDHKEVQNLIFPESRLEKTEEQHTVLNFLLQSSRDMDPETLTSRMILLTAAAFHNSSMATVQVMYNLCSMPEYIPKLRLEAETVLRASGEVWTVESLNQLARLDSFMKESQRLNASSFLGFDRKVMSTIKLSDGTVIRPGDTIAMPSGPMARDASYYNDPTKFDGFRFHQAKLNAEDRAQQPDNEFVGIEPGNLSWGHGRFSCPGRWYASLVMKLVLATLILEYDFEFPDGQLSRPTDFVMDVHVLPDMKQKILVKQR